MEETAKVLEREDLKREPKAAILARTDDVSMVTRKASRASFVWPAEGAVNEQELELGFDLRSDCPGLITKPAHLFVSRRNNEEHAKTCRERRAYV
jgi:hypothetical protein